MTERNITILKRIDIFLHLCKRVQTAALLTRTVYSLWLICSKHRNCDITFFIRAECWAIGLFYALTCRSMKSTCVTNTLTLCVFYSRVPISPVSEPCTKHVHLTYWNVFTEKDYFVEWKTTTWRWTLLLRPTSRLIVFRRWLPGNHFLCVSNRVRVLIFCPLANWKYPATLNGTAP